MSQVTIRAKSGSVTAIQLGLAHAILVAADEVFTAKPELKATQVITDENEIVTVSKVKAGYTVEFTGREFKQANVARIATPRQGACSNPHQKDAVPVPVADEQDEQDKQDEQDEQDEQDDF